MKVFFEFLREPKQTVVGSGAHLKNIHHAIFLPLLQYVKHIWQKSPILEFVRDSSSKTVIARKTTYQKL